MGAALPTYTFRPAAPSPMVLTNAELIREADALALRLAHSPLPLRDAELVMALAARLKGAK